MDRGEIAAYAMQGLLMQKSTSPGVEGDDIDYIRIADDAYVIADLLIDTYGTSGTPDLYAAKTLQALISKMQYAGAEADYTTICQTAVVMSSTMQPV